MLAIQRCADLAGASDGQESIFLVVVPLIGLLLRLGLHTAELCNHQTHHVRLRHIELLANISGQHTGGSALDHTDLQLLYQLRLENVLIRQNCRTPIRRRKARNVKIPPLQKRSGGVNAYFWRWQYCKRR